MSIVRTVFSLSFILIATTDFALADEDALQTIAFGSCADQDHPQPIWTAINAESPDLFVFLGDNIYGDTEDMEVMQEKYQKLANIPGFAELRESTPTIAIWDDHDFGENDAGLEYPEKEASRQVMLDFWDEPADSERRTREDGIYAAYEYGPEGRRVQIILLDLRWNRTALNSVTLGSYNPGRIAKDMGPFVASEDPEAVLLGEPQWSWLEEQLGKPADLRIIGSSIQLLPEFSGWESWANFPEERSRLFSLLRKLNSKGVVIISGDTHWSEFSRVDGATNYSLWEVTSSGLTEEWKKVSPNLHRVGKAYAKANYGLIEIDWETSSPSILFSIKGVEGNAIMRTRLRLNELQ